MARPVLTLRDSNAALRETGGGLVGQLSPQENLSGFEWEGSLAAGQEAQIRNKLRDGLIPTHYLVLSQEPVPTITRGITAWGQDYVYVRNVASISTVNARVYFYKHRGALE